MDWQSLAAIIGAIFSSQALTIFIQGKFSQGKTNADAASILVQSMLEWQKTLTERIAALEKELAERNAKIDELQTRLAHVEAEMARMENTKLCQ